MRCLLGMLLIVAAPLLAAPELVAVRAVNPASLPSADARPGLRIAPYVQWVTRDRATILLETATDQRVQVSLTGPDGAAKTVTSGPVRLHEIRAVGLEPATRYAYAVAAEGAELARGQFYTWPADDSTVRFFLYGDTRTRPDEHRKICQAMARLVTPEHRFVLHSGDQVSDGRVYDQWRDQFFAPGAELFGQLAVLPCPGNHERRSAMFLDYFALPQPEWYWSLDVGPMHLVALDFYQDMPSDDGSWRDTEQGQWLLRSLASDLPWKMLMVHTPIYSLGPHGELRQDGLPDEIGMRFARVTLLPMLRELGYGAVFAGHDHIYERSDLDGILHVTSGGGGAPTYQRGPAEQNPYSQVFLSQTHFCDVTVTADTLILRAYGADGALLDEVTRRR